MKLRKGFTLIELLVVIAIINILAAQLLPALSTAREKGRQANCMSNLKQFSYAIEMYQMDYNDYPDWLSTLSPSYIGRNPKIFICLSDMNKGAKGYGGEEEGVPYNNIDDCKDPKIPNSYLYTFNPKKYYDPTLGDGNLTWKEASLFLANTHGGHVPIVRCLWHYLNGKGPVLNIAYEDYNVYLSGDLYWESSSR